MAKTLSKLVQNPMTEALSYELADRLFKAAQDIMTYLYSRWQDEDIKDYQKPLTDLLKNANAENVVMKKSPFGFTCTIGGFKYQYTINSRSYSLKRG
jgi:hypothetical protein